MNVSGSVNGYIKHVSALCIGLASMLVGAGVYAQCVATITIPDNGPNTEIATTLLVLPEGYIVRFLDGYNLSVPQDLQDFEDDLNDSLITVPGIDTGMNGTATVSYDTTGSEWIIEIEGTYAVLDMRVSYVNGTTQTCSGGVQGYCGSQSTLIYATHSAECAASYFTGDTCTESAYCGAADVGTGYCFEGVCEQFLDCSDSQYVGRECLSNAQCGDGGGCNNGVCECMSPGPGVCYPGYSEPICDTEDPNACGGSPNECVMGSTRFQCICADGPDCGNGALETGEDCDDGNLFTGDGCNALCDFEVPSCEILLPANSVASGSSISIHILSQSWVTNSAARLYTGFAGYHNVTMTNGMGVRNNVQYTTAGIYTITGIVYNPLDFSNNTFAECTAELAVQTDGDCGSLFMEVITGGTYSEPIYDDVDLVLTFCDEGVFNTGTYTYTPGVGWTWDCAGEGSGAVVACNAYELACGPADGGTYDELYADDANLCGNTEYTSGFAGIQTGGLNYDGDPVSSPSYIWQCEVGGELANCEATYVDSPMCDYPVGTPCDSSNPGTGTTYDAVWDGNCQCIAAAGGTCGDGVTEGSEQCEHPTYCDDGSSCSDDLDCNGIGDELCQFRTFCTISGEICDLFNTCGIGEGDCEYDLEPGCAEDCTFETIACADFIFDEVSGNTPPFDTTTELEIEVDATASEKWWADIEIDWDDGTQDMVNMSGVTFMSDPNATHIYGTSSAAAYDVYALVSNPLSGGINETCPVDSFSINGVCGDSVEDFDEACDDGNSTGADLCANDCTLTFCGDGIFQEPNGSGTGGDSNDGMESCDGSLNCDADCTCGDGYMPDGNGGCTQDPIDGVCGDVDSTDIYDADNSGDGLTGGASNLCDMGDVGSFTYSGSVHTWFWECEGINSGNNVACSAGELYCGDSARDNPNIISGSTEECDGTTGCVSCACGTGYTADGTGSCIADVVCGPADGADYYVNPADEPNDAGQGNLCSDGNSATPSLTGNTRGRDCADETGCTATNHFCGDNAWDDPATNTGSTEECDGTTGCVACACDTGYTANGSGTCVQDAVDGVCGAVDGTDIYDLDNSGDSLTGGAANLCDTGAVENFAYSGGTRAWNCAGSGAGNDASCSATEHSCGDGTTDSSDGEACDDGNTDNNDGCSSICEIEVPLEECGSTYPVTYYTTGVTQPDIAGEGDLCTSGGTASNIAELTGVWTWECAGATGCTATNEYCGDGATNGAEECDDGNTVDDDACNNSCIATSCGDGIVQQGEQCDEGGNNGPSGTCTTGCMLTYCGDYTTQSPNGAGTGGALDDGNESCDEGPNGGTYGNPEQPDYCNGNCEAVEEPWCTLEIDSECEQFILNRGLFSESTTGILSINATGYELMLTAPSGPLTSDLDPNQPGATYSWSGVVGGNVVTCSTVVTCAIPFAPPGGDGGSSIRSTIEICEDESNEQCEIIYKSDEPATEKTIENTSTVGQVLENIVDDSLTDYGTSILTVEEVTDAFARALYIPIGNNLTALELFDSLGFFRGLDFEDGVIMKEDLVMAMIEILIRLKLIDEVSISLEDYKEIADVRDLRLVAVALRKVMMNSYPGFEDDEVRSRVVVGDRSTSIGALLCRRNGRTGCETEGLHQSSLDIGPMEFEQFYDVNRDSRVGQALAYVNAQRDIFHQRTFNEDGNVQLSVLYKTLALSLELVVNEGLVIGNDRGLVYLKELQKAGFFLDIDPATVALNHSITRGELQMYLTKLLQTAQLLPTTTSTAGPSTKLNELVTRGELVVALQQLIQLFEMYKQEVNDEIVSRQEQTPDRD